MRRYSQRQALSSLSEINITPLLDLAFVLLIIFMITTPLLESSMSLIIPSSGGKNPPVTSSQVQTVSIDRNETIRLNNRLVDLSALSAQLGEIKRTNPDVAVVIRPDQPQTVYVGNDAGVFVSHDFGVTWENMTQNLPNVSIVDLVLQEKDGTLSAATYGRSLWRTRI